MAGLDGIQNKIHPGDAADKNLYDLPPEEAKEIPQVCGSLKSEEEIKVRTFVHPLEYELYYSC
jgi:glutamine synthetase